MTKDFFVTSGSLRGQKLLSPRTFTTHPMGSRERLALFNALNSYLPGATVLDLFAGTGALGIEALSRGANQVDFVESDPAALQALHQNLIRLQLTTKTQVHACPVEHFYTNQVYDLVFADPPYPLFSRQKLPLSKICELAKDSQFFVLSHPHSFDPSILPLNLLKTRRYAAAQLSFFTPQT